MTPPPSVNPSIKIVKSFTYRTAAQLFSNRYHFAGGTPSDSTNWHALMDAIVNLEKNMFNGGVTIVDAIGYEAGSEVPVASKSYSTTGVMGGTGTPVPGDCAAVVRWATNARSVKNHPIYCFSYYHAVLRATGAGHEDELDSTQEAALGVYAAGWLSGITAGGITATRSSPAGHACTGQLVHHYIGHRDFRN